MQEKTEEHVELEAFFELLRRTPLTDISCEEYDSRIRVVKTPFALLKINHTNIRNIYEIEYKGVLVGKSEFEEERYIHNKVNEIIKELERYVKGEFLYKYKTK